MADYELGRLYEDLKRWGDARSSFNKVTSDLTLEGPLNARRGKYSLQASPCLQVARVSKI